MDYRPPEIVTFVPGEYLGSDDVNYFMVPINVLLGNHRYVIKVELPVMRAIVGEF